MDCKSPRSGVPAEVCNSGQRIRGQGLSETPMAHVVLQHVAIHWILVVPRTDCCRSTGIIVLHSTTSMIFPAWHGRIRSWTIHSDGRFLVAGRSPAYPASVWVQIGRASCRERV